MDVPGWSGGPTVIPLRPAVFAVVADLEAECVAVERQGRVPIVARELGLVEADVHTGHATCGSATGASRFLIGLVPCFATPGDTQPSRPPQRGCRLSVASESNASGSFRSVFLSVRQPST
jgi:hypothetical protein